MPLSGEPEPHRMRTVRAVKPRALLERLLAGTVTNVAFSDAQKLSRLSQFRGCPALSLRAPSCGPSRAGYRPRRLSAPQLPTWSVLVFLDDLQGELVELVDELA